MSNPQAGQATLTDWHRKVAAGIAAAHPLTATTRIRARGNHLVAQNDEPEGTRSFVIAGQAYSLAQVLAANKDDEHVCAWAIAARPGDVFREMHAEEVACVAPGARA